MNRRWMVLLPLLAISAWLAIFGDKTPAALSNAKVHEVEAAVVPSTFPPSSSPSTPITDGSNPAGQNPQDAILILQPRQQLIGNSSRHGTTNAIFGSQSWTPPSLPPTPAPPPVPTAPPLPYTFLGKQFDGGEWQVYLGRGDQTFIARKGTLIEGIYRVESTTPPELAMTYLPLDSLQTLPIGETD